MTVEIRVNSAPLDTADAPVERVLDEMKRQGWVVESIQRDGEPIEPDDFAAIESGATLIEIEAALPAEVDDESPVSRESLFDQLSATIPAFREEAEQLGLAFGRGEWRGHLERLVRFLGEIDFVQTGFRGFSDLVPGVGQHVDRLTPMLRELSQAVRAQSWVEVSDVLIYEMVPYFADFNTVIER